MRASALDASLLDAELHGLLLSPLHAALKFFHPTFISNYDPELIALLRLALWKVGIWDSNASYGSLIQNLHYRRTQNGKSLAPTRNQKLAYAAVNILVPYLLSKSESWLLQSNDRSPARWKDRLQRFLTTAENVYSSLSLLNFLIFLVDGGYRSLTDRILRLRLLPLTKSTQHHLLSYEFLNRQLTWTSLTEFLLFILPLILPSYRRLRRRLQRFTKTDTSKTGALASLPERFCAICFNAGREGRLVTNPYCGECRHVYCYTCIMGEVANEEGDGWNCLRCGQTIKNVTRWEEVEGEKPEIQDEKTDMEGEEGSERAEESSNQEAVTPDVESPRENDQDEGGDSTEEGEESEEENLFSER